MKITNLFKYLNRKEGFITYREELNNLTSLKISNFLYSPIILIFCIVLYFFSILRPYEFTGEEPLRVIVAFEMFYSGNLFQPTFLGDLYLNKPPLFNWLIILSSYFVGWSVITARIVTLLFLFLTSIGIYKFSLELTENRNLSVLSSLVYLSFIDILFWYGNYGEIDVTYGFFVFLMFYLLFKGYTENKTEYLIFSGVVAGITFLLKGFPTYLFFGLTYLGLVIFYRDWKKIFNPYIWIAGVISLIIPLIWILNTPEPFQYFKKLFLECTERGKGLENPFKFLYHLFVYLLLNFKQLLPTSGFVLVSLLIYRKQRINIPSNIKLLIFIVLINYIPYLLLVETRGRYIIPLFPIIAIIFSYLMFSFRKEKIFKVFVFTLIFLIAARFFIGFYHFPAFSKRKTSQKEVVYSIAQNIDINKKIAFDCHKDKFIAAYLEFLREKPVKKSTYIKDWDYLLTCDKSSVGKLIRVYETQAKTLYLYGR